MPGVYKHDTRGRKCAKVRTKKEKSYKKLHKKRNRTELDAKKNCWKLRKVEQKRVSLHDMRGRGTPRNFKKMRTKKELCNTITRGKYANISDTLKEHIRQQDYIRT